MSKRLNLKYPPTIYLVIFIFSIIAMIIILQTFSSFQKSELIIDYLLIITILIYFKIRPIQYKLTKTGFTTFGFSFPIAIIYGLTPIIISELVVLLSSRFQPKGEFIRRYFNAINIIVALGISIFIFQYFIPYVDGNNFVYILLIALSALNFSFIQTFSVGLMFYLEKGTKIISSVDFNIYGTNILNGIITFYLYLALDIYGLLIAILYAILFSRRSKYQAKYNQSNSELYEAEQRLRMIFETIDYGIIVFEKDMRLKIANSNALNFLRILEPNPIGKTFFDFNSNWPKEVEKMIEWSLLNEENCHQKKVQTIVKDKVFFLDVYTYPLRIAEGEIDGVILLYKNVTEEQLIRRQLIEADKLSHIGQLAAGKVHEIKNPLTTVRGYLQFLQNMVVKGETINLNHFDIALQELDRTNEIINSLLILSKNSKENFERVNLNLIINEIIELFQHQLDVKNINLNLRLDDNLIIFGFDNHLKQIIINLILNAIDAVSKKKAKEINIIGHNSANRVILRIEDNGDGISPENIEKLPTPFFTTKETGTGLGLSVTFKLVEEHGGEIKLDSKIGVGTKITISLPFQQKVM